MLRIKTQFHVFVGALVIVAGAVVLIMLHLQFNYTSDARAQVATKAISATMFIAFIFGYIGLIQVQKSYLLTLKLQQLINRDYLTDVATRDFFFNQMAQDNTNTGVSLMVDIDKFKKINDTHGHLVGDQVIKTVASTLKGCVRSEDIVCRFGGEEFLIFLTNHAPEEGFVAAERMRARIGQDAIDAGGILVSVTVSIGGAVKASMTDIEVAIQEADAALYRAKTAGRNQTVFANT